jgi:hypothetical protein
VNGLFAEHGFAVEILDPAPGAENVRRVADGEAEFCLTSVLHYLTARARWGELPARFVAVIVRQSPIAGLVAVDASVVSPEDLAGRRVGGPAEGRLLNEYCASLEARGIGEPTVVAVDYADAPAALGRGEIEVVPDFADLLPRVRRQSGIDVRVVPVGLPVYASGLVAGDRIPHEQAARMQRAVAAALRHQQRYPESGVPELCRRYPGLDRGDVLEGWSLVAPNIFGQEPASMDAARWELTLLHYSRAHDLPALEPSTVFRLELAGSAWEADDPTTTRESS